MQPLSRNAPPRRAAALAAGALLAGVASPAAAACPWIVQPYVAEVSFATPETDAPPAYEIMFSGDDVAAFYAFSVAAADLAWELADGGAALPELGDGARALAPQPTPIGTTVYELAPDTVEPATIYLVAAGAPVERLERIGAGIEPDRPVAVAGRVRGGSDQSGPLPRRTVPGFEIADAAPGQGADMQICAYQVAAR